MDDLKTETKPVAPVEPAPTIPVLEPLATGVEPSPPPLTPPPVPAEYRFKTGAHNDSDPIANDISGAESLENVPKPPAPAAKPETAEAKAERIAAEAAKVDADAEIEARRLNVIARYDMTGERAMVGNEVFCADPSASAALRTLAICLLATGGGEVAVGLSRTSGQNPGPARGEAYRDALSYLSAKRPVKAA